MKTVPLTLKQANELVLTLHRHHKPTQGHRFSIGALKEDKIVGAAIIGRPVCRRYDQYNWVEVTRLVTDGTKNTCSYLYAASARIAREMGFTRIQTYILDTETGLSLVAAGWKDDGLTGVGDWNSRTARRTDQPTGPKRRWIKLL